MSGDVNRMSGASDRLAWAVAQLRARPDDRVLELGCGHGVALSLIAERLAGGTVTGVDRSAKMTAAASARNAAWVEAGRVRILTAALHEADLGDACFDKVLAVDFPPLLRGDPRRELAVVRRHLLPAGTLHVVTRPFAADAAPATADAIAARVQAHGFEVRATTIASIASQPAVCVVAHARA